MVALQDACVDASICLCAELLCCDGVRVCLYPRLHVWILMHQVIHVSRVPFAEALNSLLRIMLQCCMLQKLCGKGAFEWYTCVLGWIPPLKRRHRGKGEGEASCRRKPLRLVVMPSLRQPLQPAEPTPAW